MIISMTMTCIYCELSHFFYSGMANDNFDYYHTIGFQIDKVKHAEMGEAKVRLTAYYAKSGKVREQLKLLYKT